jgi:peptidoglycan/xylan/chitin deacetylase (PgdA/CDA1 family)
MVVEWPGGRRVAVIVNVAYEAWGEHVAPGISPMGNPLPSGLLDTQARSWGEYGPKCGIQRILSVLDRANTRATVMVSGILAERYPETVAGISAGGHEICGHGWTQNVLPVSLGPEEERTDIARCLEALESVSGQRPVGWISPRGTPSLKTADLCKQLGLTWFGDVFDTDLPYQIDTPSGQIVGIPLGMEINDLPLLMRYGRSPADLRAEFDRLLMYRLRSGETSIIDVTVHAHVGGRPAVAGVFEDLLLDVHARGDLWVATRAELVEWFKSCP